jgi:demethylmenaquinone methyltransferase/2-methoxy-6-polyprenyl-1,4-benzoquinol methylase
MDKRPSRIQSMFGAIAGSYDLLNHGLSLNRDRAWRRAAVREAGAIGGRRVLDVCTGTGDLAIALARAAPPPAAVVGADFAEPMLRVGTAKAERVETPPVRLLGGDTLRLPFPPGTFDAVTVAFGIRNVVDLDAGLREMRRILAPGGRAVILEFNRPRNPVFRLLYETYFHLLLPIIGNLVSGSRDSAYHYLPRSVLHFPPPKELAERMERAGFAEVRIVPLDLGIVTLHVGTRP